MTTDDGTDRWLTDQHTACRTELTAVLDVDMGLREILVAEQHTDLVDALRDAPGVDAGSAADLFPEGRRRFRGRGIGVFKARGGRRYGRGSVGAGPRRPGAQVPRRR